MQTDRYDLIVRDGTCVTPSGTVRSDIGATGGRIAAVGDLSTAWAAETGCRLVILRVPGIYGPGRLGIERIRAGDRLHILNLGGVIGICTSRNLDIGEPLRVEVLGTAIRDGKPLNIADGALPPATSLDGSPPLVIVAGTCMAAGKTLAACVLGALIAIPYSYQHPREVVETNVLGTLNVLMAARQAGVERVMHTSTSEVYGTARFVPITEEHPLQGQSPYVWNFQLGYDDLDRGINTALLFNMFGERIVDVGINGAPDVYQEPRPVLDFVYAQKFRDHWKLKLRARNLLNAEVEITQGDKTRREFTVGREYQLALEWSW